MILFYILLSILAIYLFFKIKKHIDTKKYNSIRTNHPCVFDEKLTQEQFKNIVCITTAHIKRIVSVQVTLAEIECTVRSQSGESEWSFSLDFNDWGHVSGNYWIWSENSDSSLPNSLGKMIQDKIKNHFEDSTPNKKTNNFFCMYCGTKIPSLDAKFCPRCGKSTR